MNFAGIRVLVLEGYARQSLPLIKAFHALGCHVSALCGSKFDVAYASRYTDERIIGVCSADDLNATTAQVSTLLETGKYDVVVPTVDFSAALLSSHKPEYSLLTKVASNDWDVYEIAGDKLQTMRACMDKGIPCPYTLFDISSIEYVLTSGIKFPIVVKPRVGYGAIGFKKIETPQDLLKMFSHLKVDPSKYVFQEYIPQTDIQYECAMFMDDNGEAKTRLVFSKNRWFPINGGSSTLNITVDRPDIIKSCTELLHTINWRGAADIDLIQDPRDNTAKILEINPRVSGSVKICFESGVDQARQILELVYGEQVTDYPNYSIGQRLRCSQIDALWFITSKDRFKAKPSWFSFKNTKDHTFSWDDPLPWFSFLLSGLMRYKSEITKRS